MATSIKVRPIAGNIGAEISGVDLAGDLEDAVIADIRRAWLEHCVVFFRDQLLAPARFLQFAKRFGDIVEYPFIKGIDGFPEIIPVVKLEHEKTNFGGIWHSDTSYLERPPMATMLIAREVPPTGGDTLFANAYLAYEALSEGMKRMLDGVFAINSSAKADVSRTREDRVKDMKRGDAKTEYVGTHPVVRTHPETGRKALYVNIAHTLRFKDMIEAVRFDRRRITSDSFETYPILRFSQVPTVEVEIIARPEQKALGAGEAAHGPVAAAIGNAVAAALGVRVRNLPITRERIIAASS